MFFTPHAHLLIGAAIATSITASLTGWSMLSPDAVITRNSIGATWSRDVALIAFPCVVGVLAICGLALRAVGNGPGAKGFAIGAALVAGWQVAAFLRAR